MIYHAGKFPYEKYCYFGKNLPRTINQTTFTTNLSIHWLSAWRKIWNTAKVCLIDKSHNHPLEITTIPGIDNSPVVVGTMKEVEGWKWWEPGASLKAPSNFCGTSLKIILKEQNFKVDRQKSPKNHVILLKAKSSEPNLHFWGFEMLIFQGVSAIFCYLQNDQDLIVFVFPPAKECSVSKTKPIRDLNLHFMVLEKTWVGFFGHTWLMRNYKVSQKKKRER